MYAVIRRNILELSVATTRARWTRSLTGLMPQIRKIPGFVAWYLVETDPGELTTIALFETPSGGAQTRRLVHDHITSNRATLGPAYFEVTEGPVVLPDPHWQGEECEREETTGRTEKTSNGGGPIAALRPTRLTTMRIV